MESGKGLVHLPTNIYCATHEWEGVQIGVSGDCFTWTIQPSSDKLVRAPNHLKSIGQREIFVSLSFVGYT